MCYLPFANSKTNSSGRRYWDQVMTDELSKVFFDTLKKWFHENGKGLRADEKGFSALTSEAEKILQSFLATEKIKSLPRYAVGVDQDTDGIRIDPIKTNNDINGGVTTYPFGIFNV